MAKKDNFPQSNYSFDTLSRISTNLRRYDDHQKAIMRDRKVNQQLGRDAARLLRKNIKLKTENLTWGKGKQTDLGVVSFSTKQGGSSVRLRWEGRTVGFIEYGAGIYAYKNPYQGDRAAIIDYEPVAGVGDNKRRAHSDAAFGGNGGNWSGYTNQAWYFKAPAGEQGNLGGSAKPEYNVVTRGWEPIAPYYETIREMRTRNAKQLGYTEYEKAVKAALKLGVKQIFTAKNLGVSAVGSNYTKGVL